MKRRIAIRADASSEIGTGHISRCLTLADALARSGAEITFVCRPFAGNLSAAIARHGYAVDELPGPLAAARSAEVYDPLRWLGAPLRTDASQTREILRARSATFDWLITDNYAIDARWEGALRDTAQRIMAIDDLANRPHDCDLLLDQNPFPDREHAYAELVPASAVILTGPRYALLRPEFLERRPRVQVRTGDVERVLVYFGSADCGQSRKALSALAGLGRRGLAVDVIAGRANADALKLRTLCDEHGWTMYDAVETISELMLHADLALGADGFSTFERAAMGLPSIVVATAENQMRTARAFAEHGVVRYLGTEETVGEERWHEALADAFSDRLALHAMSASALALMADHEDPSSGTIARMLTQ